MLPRVERALGDLESAMARGELAPLIAYLRDVVHRHVGLVPPAGSSSDASLPSIARIEEELGKEPSPKKRPLAKGESVRDKARTRAPKKKPGGAR